MVSILPSKSVWVEVASLLRGCACAFQNILVWRHVCCRAQLQNLQDELADVRSQLADATQKVADMQIELSKEKAAMHRVGEQQEVPEDTGMETCRCRLHPSALAL